MVATIRPIEESRDRLNGPEAIQPFYRQRAPSSIDNLQSSSPILTALTELPRAPGIPCHTIVANLFPAAPPGMWTDGLVAYDSAHLDGVESEVMIHHHHFVNETIQATQEVRRILRIHLEESGTSRSARPLRSDGRPEPGAKGPSRIELPEQPGQAP